MTSEAWRQTLAALAVDASNDGLPCIEQAMILATLALRESRWRQRALAHLFSDLRDLVEDEGDPRRRAGS